MIPSNSELGTLVRRIQMRDEAAMSELHARTETTLRIYIRRIVKDAWDAEEVLQDVYTYIWLHAVAYTEERGTPSAWLYMLARSRALDNLRRRSRVTSALDEQIRPDDSSGPEGAPVEIWQHAQIRRGVRELPAAQERLIGLAFYEGYSHSEIAECTGLPLGTVKNRIRTALLKLREALPAVERRMPFAA